MDGGEFDDFVLRLLLRLFGCVESTYDVLGCVVRVGAVLLLVGELAERATTLGSILEPSSGT